MIQRARLRRSSLLSLFCILAACGSNLPSPTPFVTPITSADAGYNTLQHQMDVLNVLTIPQAYKSDGEGLLLRLAEHAKAANAYIGAVGIVNTRNSGKAATFGWLNGIVGGLGGLGAAIDSKRDWGPTVGIVGALWSAFGLTMQKAFLQPKIDTGTAVEKLASDAKTLVIAAHGAWDVMVGSQPSDQPAKFLLWKAAAEKADDQLMSLLGLVALTVK